MGVGGKRFIERRFPDGCTPRHQISTTVSWFGALWPRFSKSVRVIIRSPSP